MTNHPPKPPPHSPPTPLGTARSTDLAKSLRHDLTPPERIMWSRLRNRQIGNLKFRRQHPIGPFIVDFFCEEANLVVELDGEIHSVRRQHDASRDRWMDERGIRTLRFTVSEFMKDQDAVLTAILLEARRRIEACAGRRNDDHCECT